jgi:hypothetical protein
MRRRLELDILEKLHDGLATGLARCRPDKPGPEMEQWKQSVAHACSVLLKVGFADEFDGEERRSWRSSFLSDCFKGMPEGRHWKDDPRPASGREEMKWVALYKEPEQARWSPPRPASPPAPAPHPTSLAWARKIARMKQDGTWEAFRAKRSQITREVAAKRKARKARTKQGK